MPKQVILVANGGVAPGSGCLIDSAEMVIRFNEPSQPAEDIGSKTDILFMVNAGKSMQARLVNTRYLDSTLVRNAREIILPYHPSVIAKYHPRPNILSRLKGRRADWTWEAISVLGDRGKSVTVLSAPFYESSCDELGIAPAQRQAVFPSTGFLGVLYTLERFPAPEWRVELRGFEWTGWKRHEWKRERDWVKQKSEEGTLVLS